MADGLLPAAFLKYNGNYKDVEKNDVCDKGCGSYEDEIATKLEAESLLN